MNAFNVVLPLSKTLTGDLIGIASTTSIDRDEERMSQNALKMMVDDIKREGVNLFVDHDHKVDSIVGCVKDAELVGNQVKVSVTMDEASTNPRVSSILNKIAKGIRIGMSVGGNVTDYKWEYDHTAKKKVKVLDKVKIYEISLVGIPSNADSFVSIPQAIMKSARNTEKSCPACFTIHKSHTCDNCYYTE